jgi:hypothetical protein
MATIGVGWVLRLWQLAENPSLWLDELAVVRNIIHLPMATLLLSPLEYAQIAPVGFLAVGRILSSVIPDQEWVFRVVPFVSSLATLPVVYLVGRRLLGPFPALVAMGLIAFSPPMIGLGAVAKHYASDVFVAAALMYGGLKIIDGDADEPAALAWYGLFGGLLLFFSFTGVLVAFWLAAAVSASWLIRRPTGWARRILSLGVPLGTCAGIVTLIALRARSAETASFMAEYWETGYPGSAARAPQWLWSQLVGIYEVGFLTPYPWTGVAQSWPAVLLGLCLLGALALIAKQRRAAVIVLAPFLAAGLAAAGHLYPLVHRLGVFLTPSMALLTVAGSIALTDAARRAFGPVTRVMYAAPLMPVALALISSHPPFLVEHTRPLIRDVAQEWRPADAVYSFYAANQAMDYYGSRFGITDWVPGACARGEPREYWRQLDSLRGHPRVWVVFTHSLPRLGEAEAILGYLRTIGIERRAMLDQMDPLHTSAYLFDLSDPTRLERASADDYVFESGVEVDRPLRCGDEPASDWERPQASQ